MSGVQCRSEGLCQYCSYIQIIQVESSCFEGTGVNVRLCKTALPLQIQVQPAALYSPSCLNSPLAKPENTGETQVCSGSHHRHNLLLFDLLSVSKVRTVFKKGFFCILVFL